MDMISGVFSSAVCPTLTKDLVYVLYYMCVCACTEIATRLSPECCERLVESGATNVIFTLIRCCNRSVPCMDVITFSIQILLNLSKVQTCSF